MEQRGLQESAEAPPTQPPLASSQESQGDLPSFLSVPEASMGKVYMKGGGDMGSGSSLSQTMERQPLQFVMPTPVVQGPKLDDGGDGGGDGKHNHNGGGGGDDGGDDDDYFGSGDGDGDGEGGDGRGQGENVFMRTLIPESYDAFSIGAVFAEWMRSVADLPLIIRRAVEMGLFSAPQLVRFFSMDCRPSLARSVSRNLPPTVSTPHVEHLVPRRVSACNCMGRLQVHQDAGRSLNRHP
jgi:hypothetical protein